MSNIDKQALREEFQFMRGIYSDPADHERQLIYIAAEALLDELEAKDKQIADLKEAFRIALSAAGIDAPAAAGKGE
ncbi:TPA: hypothetical protein ACSRV8_000859 [Enterobacter hormaechei subsp. steigerwaltii]|nr:hypothetical protein [Enterobacter hormaechei subsp. steigerwaltii]